MKRIQTIAESIRQMEAKTKGLLRELERACKAERKTMRSRVPKRNHKTEVHAHSVIKFDGTLIGCVMSQSGAEKYAKNHGGRVTKVVLRAVNA